MSSLCLPKLDLFDLINSIVNIPRERNPFEHPQRIFWQGLVYTYSGFSFGKEQTNDQITYDKTYGNHCSAARAGFGPGCIPCLGCARPQTANDAHQPARDSYDVLQRVTGLEPVHR